MTQGRIRVGVLGLTHDHVWGNLAKLMALDNVELVGAAEPDAALRDRFCAEYGELVISSAFDGLLEKRRQLDAVFIFSDNRTSAELAIQAASLGLPAMLEKPMASSLALADRMRAAAARAGVQLMINWPHAWNPRLHEAHRLAAAGAVGEVFKLRYVGGHAGPREIGCSPIFCDWLYDAGRNGVGALNDQGGYAATVCRWFLGRPRRVMAMGGQLTKTDITDLDNAAMLLRYDRALAIGETSWSWVGRWPGGGPVIYGTEGTLVAESFTGGDGVSLVTANQPAPAELPAPPLPAGANNAPAYFINAIRANEPIAGLVSAEISRDAQEILEAAIISIRTGQEVALPLDGQLPGIRSN